MSSAAIPDSRHPTDRPIDPVSRWVVRCLYGFSLVALAGYATFGLHPDLLRHIGSLAALYGPAFEVFARAQVWLAGAVLAVVLYRHAGWKWLPALALLYAVSLASELAGTTWGVPFGEYGYTSLLGARWLDRVPVVIPLSWFCMAVPSYALARVRYPLAGQWPARVLLGSLILLVWDLSLDPAMSHATRYWWWGETGAYYGMPLLNLVGWFVTGVLLMLVLQVTVADGWLGRVPERLHANLYGANLVLPLGMCVAAGLWGAVLASVSVLAALAFWIAPARQAWRRSVAMAGVDG